MLLGDALGAVFKVVLERRALGGFGALYTVISFEFKGRDGRMYD